MLTKQTGWLGFSPKLCKWLHPIKKRVTRKKEIEWLCTFCLIIFFFPLKRCFVGSNWVILIAIILDNRWSHNMSIHLIQKTKSIDWSLPRMIRTHWAEMERDCFCWQYSGHLWDPLHPVEENKRRNLFNKIFTKKMEALTSYQLDKHSYFQNIRDSLPVELRPGNCSNSILKENSSHPWSIQILSASRICSVGQKNISDIGTDYKQIIHRNHNTTLIHLTRSPFRAYVPAYSMLISSPCSAHTNAREMQV